MLSRRQVLIVSLLACSRLGSSQTISHAGIRIEVDPGQHRETILVHNNGEWKPALGSDFSTVFVRSASSLEVCVLTQAEPIHDGLLLRGKCPAGSYAQRLTFTAEDDVLNVSTTLKLENKTPIYSVEDRYNFLPPLNTRVDDRHGPLDFVWSQNIKSEADDLIPANSFKSPTVMMQQGNILAALMPDLNQHHAEVRALDLDVTSGPHPWLAYGAISSEPHDHSYFRRSLKTPLVPVADSIEYHYAVVLSEQPEKLGYRRIVRRLWTQLGHPALLQSPNEQQNVLRPELASFSSWQAEAWHDYADRIYSSFACASLTCGTLASNRNFEGNWQHPQPDAWFNAWFQTLRTAYGWYQHGRATHDTAMMAKAESILNLALSAPQQQGAFPTIYLLQEHKWIPGDGWAGYADSYQAFSMSWTAYWMLRWAEDLVPERRNEILRFVKPYGDFLLAHQQSSGVIPSWYLAQTLQPRVEFRDFNAETAPSALLLATLGQSTGDTRYTQAAERAMAFVTNEVVPRQRWFDYETYLSCARKDYSFFDQWTAQYPQNNLAEIQAPQAMLALYKQTGTAVYLQRGTEMLDYLLLTQQVWNNPLFTPALLGGFTTQNTDQEWSDARQSYAASLLADYYQVTGNVEYLERAVAAARSTFAVAPWENWAHTGVHDQPGALTGFHWGTGSSTTTVELMQPDLGDAYIDLRAGKGVGFDQCTITDVHVEGSRIAMHMASPSHTRSFLVRFGGVKPGETYTIQWNDAAERRIDGGTLIKEGLTIPSLGDDTN